MNNTILEEKNVKYITFGSPIMDLIVDVDSHFVDRYEIKLDTTSHVCRSTPVFNELLKMNPYINAGGCSYNAIRVFNWFLKDTKYANQVGGIGAVGNDDMAIKFKNLVERENISCFFEEIDNEETACCATICKDRERCHLTDLGASTKISEHYFNELLENQLKNIEMVYTELYILSHKKDLLIALGEKCLSEGKIFGFNLPSIGFINHFSKDICEMIEYADIVFANKEEAKYMAKKLFDLDEKVIENENSLMKEIAIRFSKLKKKADGKTRTVVITCGPSSAFLAQNDFITDKTTILSNDPFLVPEDSIVDTNGAGDAFAGAFLAFYIQKFDLLSCLKAGHWAATQTIQKRGFQINISQVVPTKEELLNAGTDLYLKKEGNTSSMRIVIPADLAKLYDYQEEQELNNELDEDKNVNCIVNGIINI